MLVGVDRFVSVRVFVGVTMFMQMIGRVSVFVRMRMLVLVVLHGMGVIVLVVVFSDDVDLGSGEAAAGDLACFKSRTDVQGGSSVLEQREGNAGVDEGTEKHVARDTGEAF